MYLARRWIPLIVCGISQKKSVDLHFHGMTSSLLYFLQSPKWTVSLFLFSSYFTTAVFVFLSMLIICPRRWIQCFPWFSTLTWSPTQRHKASKLVDTFFLAPPKRDMIQDDAILHKQLPSPCSHSSSSTIYLTERGRLNVHSVGLYYLNWIHFSMCFAC